MKDIPTVKVCSRKGCNDLATVSSGPTNFYCEKHYCFRRMRSDARKRGKKVPTWKQLDEMLLECVDEHGNLEGCSSCGQQMQWRAGEDRKIGASISLQHNHDDTECFICHSCNAGHGGSKLGDRYLGLTAKGLKHCVNCGKNKPFDQFGNRK